MTSPRADLTLAGIADSSLGFTTTQGTTVSPMPGRLRMADIDMDSYIDVVISMNFLNTTSSQYLTLTGLLMNTEANTTLSNGNERVLIPTPDTSLYN